MMALRDLAEQNSSLFSNEMYEYNRSLMRVRGSGDSNLFLTSDNEIVEVTVKNGLINTVRVRRGPIERGMIWIDDRIPARLINVFSLIEDHEDEVYGFLNEQFGNFGDILREVRDINRLVRPPLPFEMSIRLRSGDVMTIVTRNVTISGPIVGTRGPIFVITPGQDFHRDAPHIMEKPVMLDPNIKSDLMVLEKLDEIENFSDRFTALLMGQIAARRENLSRIRELNSAVEGMR